MNAHRSFAVSLAICLVAAGCGSDGATGAGSGSAAASAAGTTQATAAAGTSTSTAASTADAPKTANIEAGSVAELREKASGVMAALKRGDAKAAADYCLGKHRDGLEKYIAETIEKKDGARAKAYAAYDGKLGEIRVDGDKARVKIGEDADRVEYLSFRKKDGTWSLFDIPGEPKKAYEEFGKVVTE